MSEQSRMFHALVIMLFHIRYVVAAKKTDTCITNNLVTHLIILARKMIQEYFLRSCLLFCILSG